MTSRLSRDIICFFFFSVGDLDERDTIKPEGKVCVGREGPSFSIFFLFRYTPSKDLKCQLEARPGKAEWALVPNYCTVQLRIDNSGPRSPQSIFFRSCYVWTCGSSVISPIMPRLICSYLAWYTGYGRQKLLSLLSFPV